MKSLHGLFAVTLLALCCAATAWSYPQVYPTGTTLYKPDKAWNGFTVLNGKSGEVVLVDMNGNAVHSWPGGSLFFRPLPEGNLLAHYGNWALGQQDAYATRQYGFDKNIVWEFRKWHQADAIDGEPQESGKTWISRGHHDVQRKGVPGYYTPAITPDLNTNTLILGHINERSERINKDAQLLTDAFYEVDMNGNVVWQWSATNHLDELGFDEDAIKTMQSFPPKDNPIAGRHNTKGKPGAGYDWLHINALSYVGPNKWYDAGDQRFHPDNVIFSSRDANLFGIVDRKSNKVVWRVGPDYGPGSKYEKIGQIIGSHAVHVIPKGLPGEGNVLVFDNGGLGGYGKPNVMVPLTGFHNARRDYSRVVEINPVTLEVVWEYDHYKSHPDHILGHFGYHFFSPFVSYAQRLPNGNTLITEGDSNRLFEITPSFETVWEYVNPYTFSNKHPLTYRAYRVPYEWVPQGKKAEEVPVTPVPNSSLHLPNDKGQMPNMGLEGKSVLLSGSKGVSYGASASSESESEEMEQPSMHSY